MGIPRFLLSLVVAVMLAFIVTRIANPILEGSRETANTAKGAQAVEWLQLGVDNLFLWFLVIAVFGLVALAVFQREVLG